jgi:hypothetical protein
MVSGLTFIKRYAVLSISILALCLAPSSVFASDTDETIEKIGDVFQILLPATAFGSTFLVGNPEGGRWDKEGTKQATLTIGSALATSSVIKFAAGKMRPNGNSRTSFPSGHTTAAFTGASFINIRYGPKFGVPALAAAVYTGWSRVYSSWHFADDVTAGASIGLMSAWMFTTPRSESFSISPVVGDDGTGVSVTVGLDGEETPDVETQEVWQPRWRYDWGFGPAFIQTNEITSPSSSGTTFDLADFAKMDDPTTTASINIAHAFENGWNLAVFFAPFESRDTAVLTDSISFGGETFPAGDRIQSGWVLYDLRLYGAYPVLSWLGLGAGLAMQSTRVELLSAVDSTNVEVRDEAIAPFLIARLSWDVSRKITLLGRVSGTALDKYELLDLSLYARWHVHPRWDLAGGVWHSDRTMETEELMNNTEYNGPYLAVAYSW